MQILTLGNELLKQKAQPVEKIGAEHFKLAEEMLDILHREKGIGLAAVQVGRIERIFVVHLADDVPRVFINPTIIETSQETVKYEEGCLSVPGIYSDVVRPARLKIQAWNEKGRAFVLEADEMLARVIFHEYDHLEGVLFIDRVPAHKRERLIEKFAKGEAKMKRKSEKENRKKEFADTARAEEKN